MSDHYLLKCINIINCATNFWLKNHKTEYLKLISRYILDIYLGQLSRDLK